MFDASKLDIRRECHRHPEPPRTGRTGTGLFLEAELGEVGGKDGAHAPGVRTDPDEADGFRRCDRRRRAGRRGRQLPCHDRRAPPRLDFDLIARLRTAVPVPLVLHGSSGVADAELRKAVRAGITKINVGTLLNVRFTAAVRAHLDSDGEVNDPRRYLIPARTAITEAVAAMITAID